MNRRALTALTSLSMLAVATLVGASSPSALIPFPEGYRYWTHVKSALNEPPNAPLHRYRGMYHIYANDLALEGYRAGKFPDGSVIVFDMHPAEKQGQVTVALARSFIDVMRKDSKLYPATGGWSYEKFEADAKSTRTVSMKGAEMTCHACHARQKDSDYIYSSFTE